MEVSNVNPDVNKIAVPATPAIENEDKVNPQVKPVQGGSESASAALNDRALHGRDKEEDKNRAGGMSLSREDLEKIVEEVQKRLDAIGSNLSLGLKEDKDTEVIVAQIRDKSSDKLVRQFPSEEVLKLRAKLDELIGVIFDKKA